MAVIYTPPMVIPEHDRIKHVVFLAGSIEGDTAEQWQLVMCEALGKLVDLTILNPRREKWDTSWANTIDNHVFKEQVDWELDGIELADTVVFYFDPNTKSPITLLELGIVSQLIRLDKCVIICCPDGYFRKGNVDIVVDRMKKAIKENAFFPANSNVDDYVMVVNNLTELRTRAVAFIQNRITPTMRSINEALELDSLTELKKEIEQRQGLLENMVGTFGVRVCSSRYPSIIRDEIKKLNERYSDIYYLVKANVEHLAEN